MDDTMRSCREFTAVLSSAAPTPGGGGAAALTAAVGTALCGMVANLTTGKKAYSAVEGDIQQLLSTTNALQEKLLDQVAADAEGFLPLASVYALPKDAPPIGSVLTAFAQPTITAVEPAGKRLNAEGVMAVTLIYLPMDSDIPMAIHTREPFAMTFPIETTEDAQVQARVIEATPGPATSDRAEVRCVVGLHVVKHGVRPLDAVIDVAQSVVSRGSGLVIADTDIRIDSVIVGLEAKLAEMELGALFGLWVQSMFVGFTMWALAICIFIITYGRMIEIYLVTSVAPIPMATMANREWGQMGQNYLRSLFALGFQAFLIIICVAIYAILVRGIAVESDVSTAIWTCMGYTVLLCFTLFKTSSLARSIFHAH